MGLSGKARSFGRHRLLIGALTLVGLAGALGCVAAQAPQYQSTAQVFVSAGSVAGNGFGRQAAEGYARVATTPYILEPVIRQLRLALTHQQLGAKISSTVVASSPSLQATFLAAAVTRSGSASSGP